MTIAAKPLAAKAVNDQAPKDGSGDPSYERDGSGDPSYEKDEAPAYGRRLLNPPSERDAEVFHAIAAEGVSTREVARHFEISQTRVRQIVQQVVRWLAAVLPAEAAAVPPATALLLAQHLAAQRMDTLFEHAMICWRQRTETKYATLLLRIAAARARLPAAGSIRGLIAEQIEDEPLAADPFAQSQPTAGVESSHPVEPAEPPTADLNGTADSVFTPPVEDCSDEAFSTPLAPQLEPLESADFSAASVALQSTYDISVLQNDSGRASQTSASEPLLTSRPDHGSLPTLELSEDETKELLRRTSRRAEKLRRASRVGV
jgi:hypothetical protein